MLDTTVDISGFMFIEIKSFKKLKLNLHTCQELTSNGNF